jgi:predicted DNA-binding protein (UPF0251 family)
MARPIKCRRADYFPETQYFKPAGIPLRLLEEVCLSIEEAEAVRLKDLEGLEQEQGAERMNFSRPTFQRILASARLKIADVMLNGKAIRIEGGTYEITPRHYKCSTGHEWEVPFEKAAKGVGITCPVNSAEITPSPTFQYSCRQTHKPRCCQRG